jgi:hypothetical protein
LDEILNWLRPQHNGLRTYKAFQQKALQLARTDREHSAAFFLLASLVGRFIDHYDEEPLPAGVADQAFKQLVGLVEKTAQSLKSSAADQLRILNEIATTELD